VRESDENEDRHKWRQIIRFPDSTKSSFPMKSGSRPGVLFGRPARRTIMYATHFLHYSPDFSLKPCLTQFSLSNLFTPHIMLLKVCSLQCQIAPACMISSEPIRLLLAVAFIPLYVLKDRASRFETHP